MKILRIFSILLLLSIHIQAAITGQITKVRESLVLIECSGSVGSENDIITIRRQSGNDIIDVGTAKVIKIKGSKAVAKILSEDDGLPISEGDFVGDGVPAGFDDLVVSNNIGNGDSPVQRLLAQAWPIYPENQDLSLTSLEKMWSGLVYRE